MGLFKKIYKYFAFKKINGLWSGPKKYEKKVKVLRKCGFRVGDGTKIVGPIFISAKIEIGNNCFIEKNFSAEGNGKIVIGDNVDIAPNVVISTGSHKIGTSDRRAGEGITTNLTIGNGSWICNSSILFSDVGCGCVVAAGTVLLNSYGDNVLIVGQPGIVKKQLG